MLLSEVKKGFEGEVKALVGSSVVADRLRELGFTTGEKIRYLGSAPFGEPMMVEVRGAIVALRLSEAACIQI